MTTPAYQPIEQQANQQKQLNVNHQATAWTFFLEHFDLAAIYTMFLNPVTHHFLETIGKFFMFPFAAAANVVLAILSWRQVYLERSTHSILNAIVQTVAAAAITIAIVGALAASVIFATVTPIMFTATLGFKALYHAGQTLYQFIAGKLSVDTEQRQAHFAAATKHGISALAGTAATAAVACVFLMGQLAFAGLGMVVSILLMGYAAYLGVTAYQAAQALRINAIEVPPQDERPNSTVALLLAMDHDEKATMAAEEPLPARPEPTPTLASAATPEYAFTPPAP